MVATLYASARGSWQGCEWHTRFGGRSVDLCSLRSNQTRLLAAATSGEESQAWEEASTWLEQVERDANVAETAAWEAVQLVENLDFAAAEERIQEAVRLETKYRTTTIWGPLSHLIGELHSSSLTRH